MLYRRFGYLQARVLLDKQDELRRLEDELDKYDRDNIGYVTTTVLPFDQAAVRKVLFEKIEQSFNAYGMIRQCDRLNSTDYRYSEFPNESTTTDGLWPAKRLGIYQCLQLP